MRILSRFRCPCFSIFVLVLVFAGCVRDKLHWLPDSSGVIFTDKDGSRLVHFDVAKNAKRIVVANTGTKTPMPAMRSDGTQLAVAKRERSYTQGSRAVIDTMQIQIYDLKGELLKVSRPYVIVEQIGTDETSASLETKTELVEAGLDWSGPHSKILTEDAIYDCLSDTWTSLDGAEPLLDASAVRPDGKGFIASGKTGAFFVTWDGWRSEFKNLEALSKRVENKPDSRDGQGRAEWRGAKFVIDTAKGVLELDTDSMEATLDVASPPVLPVVVGSRNGLTDLHVFPSTGYQICEFSGDGDAWRLELQDIKRGRQKVLLSKRDFTTTSEFRPSPDGKYVAVRLGGKASLSNGGQVDKQGYIYIFDGNGNVVATATCEE